MAITGSPELNTSKEQRDETKNRVDSDMSFQGTSGEILDTDYIASLKKDMVNLKQQKEDAVELGNDEEVAKLKEKISIIEKQCLTYVKQNGKSYEFIDRKQKSKKDPVLRGVTRCIKKIKKGIVKNWL